MSVNIFYLLKTIEAKSRQNYSAAGRQSSIVNSNANDFVTSSVPFPYSWNECLLMRVLCHWYHEIQWERHLFWWIIVRKDIFAFIPNHLHWHFWSLEIYLCKAWRPDFLIIFNLPFLIIICMMSPKGRKRIIHSFDVLFSLKNISKIVRFHSTSIRSFIFYNQISLPLTKFWIFSVWRGWMSILNAKITIVF